MTDLRYLKREICGMVWSPIFTSKLLFVRFLLNLHSYILFYSYLDKNRVFLRHILELLTVHLFLLLIVQLELYHPQKSALRYYLLKIFSKHVWNNRKREVKVYPWCTPIRENLLYFPPCILTLVLNTSIHIFDCLNVTNLNSFSRDFHNAFLGTFSMLFPNQ